MFNNFKANIINSMQFCNNTIAKLYFYIVKYDIKLYFYIKNQVDNNIYFINNVKKILWNKFSDNILRYVSVDRSEEYLYYKHFWSTSGLKVYNTFHILKLIENDDVQLNYWGKVYGNKHGYNYLNNSNSVFDNPENNIGIFDIYNLHKEFSIINSNYKYKTLQNTKNTKDMFIFPFEFANFINIYHKPYDYYASFISKKKFFNDIRFIDASFFYYKWYINYFSTNIIMFEKIFILSYADYLTFEHYLKNNYRIFPDTCKSYLGYKYHNLATTIEFSSTKALITSPWKHLAVKYQRHIQLQFHNYYVNLFKKYILDYSKAYFNYATFNVFNTDADYFSKYYVTALVNSMLNVSASYIFIKFLFNVLLATILFYIIIGFIAQTIKKIKIFSIYLIIDKINAYIEQNLANFSELKKFFLVYITFFFSIFFTFMDLKYYTDPDNLRVFMLIFLFIVCFVLPSVLLLNFGLFFLICIKGKSKDSSFAQQYFTDVMSLYAFFIRFVLQSVRIFLIMIVFFVFHEFMFSEFINDILNKEEDFLAIIFINLGRFIAEFLDLVLIVVMQGFAYMAILFWLFSFLFSSTFIKNYENFFTLWEKNKYID